MNKERGMMADCSAVHDKLNERNNAVSRFPQSENSLQEIAPAQDGLDFGLQLNVSNDGLNLNVVKHGTPAQDGLDFGLQLNVSNDGLNLRVVKHVNQLGGNGHTSELLPPGGDQEHILRVKNENAKTATHDVHDEMVHAGVEENDQLSGDDTNDRQKNDDLGKQKQKLLRASYRLLAEHGISVNTDEPYVKEDEDGSVPNSSVNDITDMGCLPAITSVENIQENEKQDLLLASHELLAAHGISILNGQSPVKKEKEEDENNEVNKSVMCNNTATGIATEESVTNENSASDVTSSIEEEQAEQEEEGHDLYDEDTEIEENADEERLEDEMEVDKIEEGQTIKQENDTTECRLYSCTFCGKTLPGQQGYKKHLENAHGRKAVSCRICTGVYASKRNLEHHSLNTHAISLTEVMNMTAQQLQAIEKKLYACQTCGKTFQSAYYLRLHERRHTRARKFVCNICGKDFTLKQILANHMKVHSNDREFKCNLCDKAFKLSQTLALHLRTHVGEKPHVCNVCNKTFSRSGHLKAHSRSHTGDKFRCEICGKTFIHNYKYSKHMKLHSGEGFKCSECGRCFSEKYILNSHMKVHDPAKPIKCKLCTYRFDKKHLLQKHMTMFHVDLTTESKDVRNGRTGRFMCDGCDESMEDQMAMRTHVLKHMGDTPLSCGICKRQLRHSFQFRQHMEGHVRDAKQACRHCKQCFSSKEKLNYHIMEKCTKAEKEEDDVRDENQLKAFCDGCDKSASVKDIRAHVLVHEGETKFSCGICKKQSQNELQFEEHMRLHVIDVRYTCEKCGKIFVNKYRLNAHIKYCSTRKPKKNKSRDGIATNNKKSTTNQIKTEMSEAYAKTTSNEIADDKNEIELNFHDFCKEEKVDMGKISAAISNDSYDKPLRHSSRVVTKKSYVEDSDGELSES